MNIGYEEDELLPYSEPDPNLDDPIRIRKSDSRFPIFHAIRNRLLLCFTLSPMPSTPLYPPRPPAPLPPCPPEKMLQMGFTLKEIQESLSENRYDEVCATYMLLAREVDKIVVREPLILWFPSCKYRLYVKHVSRNLHRVILWRRVCFHVHQGSELYFTYNM